jgi:hypothetical protein
MVAERACPMPSRDVLGTAVMRVGNGEEPSLGELGEDPRVP